MKPTCPSTQYFSTQIQMCNNCSDRFNNCLACDETRCLICEPNYFFNPRLYVRVIGKYIAACVLNSCPDGYCLNNDLNQCFKSSIIECRHCKYTMKRINGIVEESETCQQCSKGYFLDDISNSCVKQNETMKVNFFVTSETPLKLSEAQSFEKELKMSDLSNLKIGLSLENPFPLLLFAFKQLSYLASRFKKLEATIYLTKGEHFMFDCTNRDTEQFKITPFLSSYYNWCQLFREVYKNERGKFSIDKNDNYNITIQALGCEMKEKLVLSNITNFYKLCVNMDQADPQPNINVMNPYSYFNVTGTMKFRNLRFSGLQALAQPSKDLNINEHNILPMVPILYCNMSSRNNFSIYMNRQTVMNISNMNYSKLQEKFWNCKDHFYSGSFTPYQNVNNDLRCSQEASHEGIPQSATLSCPGSPIHADYFKPDSDDPSFINGYPWRRATLFNIYEMGDDVSDNRSGPNITVENCTFQDFYGGYESLFYFETDNIFQVKKIKATYSYNFKESADYEYLASNGQNRGATLTITYSEFKDSRFCRGLIYYRKFPDDSPNQDSLLRIADLHFDQTLNHLNKPLIYLSNTLFSNLNSFTNLTALQKIKGTKDYSSSININSIQPFPYPTPQHHGIVLNVKDFTGPIEITSSRFEFNAHFLPEIKFKFQRNQESGIGMGSNQKLQFARLVRGNGVQEGLEEYRMGICDSNTKKDQHFMETVLTQAEDVEDLYEEMERMSVIYISGNPKTVILDGNTFFRNIGLFGIITINAPDRSNNNLPFIAFLNNYFENNQAYLSGNSIYVRYVKITEAQYCGGIYSFNNHHYQQVGYKIHNGGAMSLICKTVDNSHPDSEKASWSPFDPLLILEIDLSRIEKNSYQAVKISNKETQQVLIDSDHYEDNNSGQRGSAVQIRNFTNIEIKNTIFGLNGPVYAPYVENQYSPYFSMYSQHYVNFNDTECRDEFEYLEICYPQYAQKGEVLWSRTQGALYVEFCRLQECFGDGTIPQKLIVQNSFFHNNDAGSLLDQNYEKFGHLTASSVFIDGGRNILFETTTFTSTWGRHVQQYFPTITSTSQLVKGYYPANYFSHSHSPIINIITEKDEFQMLRKLIFQPIIYQITLDRVSFSQNRNIQTQKFKEQAEDPSKEKFSQAYYGMALSVRNNNANLNYAIPIVKLDRCSFTDNYFAGNQSSIIYAENSHVTISNSNFQNNGYIMNTNLFVPLNNFQNSPQFLAQQQFGILYLNNSKTTQLPMGNQGFHLFQGNTIKFFFMEVGLFAVYSKNHEMIFRDNSYTNVYSMTEGAILTVKGHSHETSLLLINETYHNIYSRDQGIFGVSNNHMVNLLIYDSLFRNIKAAKSAAIKPESVKKLIFNNTHFTQDANFSNHLAISSLYSRLKNAMSFYVNSSLFRSIVTDLNHENGLIHMTKDALIHPQRFTFFQGRRVFTWNTDNSVIMNDCSVTNITWPQNNAFILFDSDYQPQQLFLRRVRVFNVSTRGTGIITIGQNSRMVADQLIIEQCNAQKAAGIFIQSNSIVFIVNSRLINNRASKQSIIIVMQKSYMDIEKSEISSNWAEDSTALYQYQDSFLRITNSQIQNNFGRTSLMTLMQVTSTFVNVTFQDNQFNLLSNGPYILNGQAFFENITVQQNQQLQSKDIMVNSGFLMLNMLARVQIKNSQFSNLGAKYAAFIKIEGFSSALLQQIKVENCNSTFGSLIHGDNAELIKIENSQFTSNQGRQEIQVEETRLQISNTQFQAGSGRYIEGKGSSLSVNQSTFMGGAQVKGSGKGILSLNQAEIIVQNCKFVEMNVTENGAAITVQQDEPDNNSSVMIFGNEFIANNASKGSGGAVSIEGPLQTILQKNLFLGNIAQRGGGLYFLCSSQDLQESNINQKIDNCDMQLRQNNNFTRNYASQQGGAIQWDNVKLRDDQSTIYTENFAPYSSIRASNPKGMWLEFSKNNDYYNIFERPSFLKQLSLFPDIDQTLGIFGQIPKIVPGKPFEMLLFITDRENSLYSPILDNFRGSLKLTESNSVNTRLINYQAKFQKGYFNFSGVQINSIPGSEVELQFEFSGYEKDFLPLLLTGSLQKFRIKLRECVEGEELTSDLKCQKCPEGTFLLNGTQGNQNCIPCQKNAKCYGGQMIVPDQGYYRKINEGKEFLECPNKEACLGGDKSYIMGKCGVGYEGEACIECQNGFYQTNGFQCKKCPSFSRSQNQIIIAVLIGFVIVCLVCASSIKTGIQIQPILQALLKILINHFQILMIISTVDFQWPVEIEYFQSGLNYFTSSSDQLFSLQCLFNGYDELDNNGTSSYYYNLILYAVAFPAVTVTAFILYTIICWVLRDFSSFFQSLMTILVIIMHLIYPNITMGIFQSFNCEDVFGTLRLKSFAKAICFQGDHFYYFQNAIIPTVVLWVIGTPAAIMCLILKERKVIESIEKVEIEKNLFEKLVNFKNSYGYLISGLKKEKYYWEMLIQLLKVILIASTVFLSKFSPELQTSMLLIILTVSYVIHQKYKPYYTPSLNGIVTSSFIVHLTTLYLGLIYTTSRHYHYLSTTAEAAAVYKSSIHWFFLTLLLLPNLYLLIIWLHNLRIELIKLSFTRLTSRNSQPSSIFLQAAYMFLSCRSPEEQIKKAEQSSDQKQQKVSMIQYHQVLEKKEASIIKKAIQNDQSEDQLSFDEILKIEGKESERKLNERQNFRDQSQQRKSQKRIQKLEEIKFKKDEDRSNSTQEKVHPIEILELEKNDNNFRDPLNSTKNSMLFNNSRAKLFNNTQDLKLEDDFDGPQTQQQQSLDYPASLIEVKQNKRKVLSSYSKKRSNQIFGKTYDKPVAAATAWENYQNNDQRPPSPIINNDSPDQYYNDQELHNYQYTGFVVESRSGGIISEEPIQFNVQPEEELKEDLSSMQTAAKEVKSKRPQKKDRKKRDLINNSSSSGRVKNDSELNNNQ